MFSMLDPRIWLAVALAIALSFGGGYFKGRSDGAKQVRLEWDAAVSLANSQARHLEQERQRRADDAARIAAAREAGIRHSADLARADANGLRDTLSAVERASADSLAASNEALRVTAGLFGRCTSLYLGVAEAAERADTEARELRQSWPK